MQLYNQSFTPTRSQCTQSALAVAENNQPSTCGSALAPAEAAHGTFRSVHTGKSFFRSRHKDRHSLKIHPPFFVFDDNTAQTSILLS